MASERTDGYCLHPNLSTRYSLNDSLVQLRRPMIPADADQTPHYHIATRNDRRSRNPTHTTVRKPRSRPLKILPSSIKSRAPERLTGDLSSPDHYTTIVNHEQTHSRFPDKGEIIGFHIQSKDGSPYEFQGRNICTSCDNYHWSVEEDREACAARSLG